MSSTQEGSSAVAVSSKKTEKGNRRNWTSKEETTLISSLKELIAQGWKSDNGFRAGYLGRLEVAMRKEFPSTDLKAMPHINSKLSAWKKSYYSLTGMLSRSGVGFNLRGNYMVDCEDDQWDQIVKIDPNARLMRYKQWPYFDDWKEMFGKDRATGDMAEDIPEAWIDMQTNDTEIPNEDAPTDNEFTSENEVFGMEYDQVSESARDAGPSRSRKKRKVNDDLQEICNLLSDMNQSTNDRLQHLANRIGYEFDMGKARQETFDQLGEIPGLSLENRFIVCEMVTFKMERLDIWRGMKQDARAQYVEHLLRSKD